MKPNLFLDSDGVIFDFDQHVMHHSGGKTPNQLGDKPLWDLVNSVSDFWATMPLFPWAHDLIDYGRQHDAKILTGCPKSGYEVAAEGKIAKYAKHFPGVQVITCLSRNKTDYMANPGDVLVDDTFRNIKRWSAAGGTAIFFRSYQQAISDLKRIFG